MAYGGKNTRSSIADQITAAIEADMDIFCHQQLQAEVSL